MYIIHSISNHIGPIVKYILILGRIIHMCSAIANIMEFTVMLEMVANQNDQIVGSMSYRS
jgi:sialic acid synthase SpsE